jgi:hypothetical protein
MSDAIVALGGPQVIQGIENGMIMPSSSAGIESNSFIPEFNQIATEDRVPHVNGEFSAAPLDVDMVTSTKGVVKREPREAEPIRSAIKLMLPAYYKFRATPVGMPVFSEKHSGAGSLLRIPVGYDLISFNLLLRQQYNDNDVEQQKSNEAYTYLSEKYVERTLRQTNLELLFKHVKGEEEKARFEKAVEIINNQNYNFIYKCLILQYFSYSGVVYQYQNAPHMTDYESRVYSELAQKMVTQCALDMTGKIRMRDIWPDGAKKTGTPLFFVVKRLDKTSPFAVVPVTGKIGSYQLDDKDLAYIDRDGSKMYGKSIYVGMVYEVATQYFTDEPMRRQAVGLDYMPMNSVQDNYNSCLQLFYALPEIVINAVR